MKQLIKNRWKPFSLAALMAVGLFGLSNKADAAKVMCLKTNTGQYIEVVRVSMMVVADGASTFEIVVKDGLGATNVESISFEAHESDIDLVEVLATIRPSTLQNQYSFSPARVSTSI